MNAQQRRKLRRQERRAATGKPPALPMTIIDEPTLCTGRASCRTLSRETPTVEEERLELAVRPRTGLAIAAGIGVGAALVGGIWAVLAVML